MHALGNFDPAQGRDSERDRAAEEYNLLTHTHDGSRIISGSAHGYLIEGDVDQSQAERLLRELLVDDLAEVGRLGVLGNPPAKDMLATVLLAPGVMDPVALSVVDAARDLGVPVASVRTFRRYFGPPLSSAARDILFRKVLANEAIEQVVAGPLTLDHLSLGTPYTFSLITVPLRDLDDAALLQLSREGQLALNLAEMQAVQSHFRDLGRDPTDVELETHRPDVVGTLLAQDAQGADRLRRPAHRQPAQGNDLRRHAGDPPAARARTTGASASSRTTPASCGSTTAITSASRSRRTTTPRPSSRTAGPTPAWAA